MRIQITESNGMTYYITSSDPIIIGAWFAEHMPKMISANSTYNHPFTMDVYPTEEHEFKNFNVASTFLSTKGKAAWLDLIEYMDKLADAMEE